MSKERDDIIIVDGIDENDITTSFPDFSRNNIMKFEKFEALAQADVATFLYRFLKYYDQLQTVYTTIDLKLQDLEAEAGKRLLNRQRIYSKIFPA